MLAASASLLNIPVVILDVGEHAPAKQILAPRAPDLAHVDGSFTDPDKIRDLAAKVDVLTVEIEHIRRGRARAGAEHPQRAGAPGPIDRADHPG